jgi:hypothetical protein
MSVCDPSRFIGTYMTTPLIDPCNAANSIGTYDPSFNGDHTFDGGGGGGGGGGNDCCRYTVFGYKSLNTTHTFTSTDIPALADNIVSGELTLYLQNPGSNKVNVTLCLLARAGGSGTAVIYQKVGNYAATGGVTLDSQTFSNTGNLVFTYNPFAECRWVFRGF